MVAVLVIAAFTVRRRSPAPSAARVPIPWQVGAVAFVASSVFMGTGLLLPAPGSAADWGVVGLYLGLFAVTIALVLRWSRASSDEPGMGWGDRHRLALAGGALLTYVWYGWPGQPVIGARGQVDLVGNAVFSIGAVVLLAAAAARVRRPATTG